MEESFIRGGVVYGGVGEWVPPFHVQYPRSKSTHRERDRERRAKAYKG